MRNRYIIIPVNNDDMLTLLISAPAKAFSKAWKGMDMVSLNDIVMMKKAAGRTTTTARPLWESDVRKRLGLDQTGTGHTFEELHARTPNIFFCLKFQNQSGCLLQGLLLYCVGYTHLWVVQIQGIMGSHEQRRW